MLKVSQKYTCQDFIYCVYCAALANIRRRAIALKKQRMRMKREREGGDGGVATEEEEEVELGKEWEESPSEEEGGSESEGEEEEEEGRRFGNPDITPHDSGVIVDTSSSYVEARDATTPPELESEEAIIGGVVEPEAIPLLVPEPATCE